MTKKDVLCKAIATATGETETKILQLLEVVEFFNPVPGLKVEISDDEAHRLIETFGTIEGKRAIEVWLLKGQMDVVADLNATRTQKTPH